MCFTICERREREWGVIIQIIEEGDMKNGQEEANRGMHGMEEGKEKRKEEGSILCDMSRQYDR